MSFISVNQRKQDVAESFSDFKKHILSPRPKGSVLNNLECLGIAMSVRETNSSHYPGEIPTNACLRPGTDFFAWLQNVKCEFPPSIPISSDEKRIFLARTVHAVGRYQQRLDKKWYFKTLEEIKKLYLSEATFRSDEAKEVKAVSIFCEIVTILATSKGFHMHYLASGEEVPDLPNVEEVEAVVKNHPGPYEELDMMSFLTNLRRDESVSEWSPFYIYEDIDKESVEWKTMTEYEKRWFAKSIPNEIQPRICSYLAPFDAKVLMDTMWVLYIKNEEKKYMKQLPSRCEGVSRIQLETVSAGYTGAVDCDY